MTEAEFQKQVIELAQMNGWLYHHISPKFVRGRWLSDSPGFPDLVMAHPRRGFILAELKAETGRMTPEQGKWLYGAEGHYVETYLWRPGDLEFIAQRLTGRA